MLILHGDVLTKSYQRTPNTKLTLPRSNNGLSQVNLPHSRTWMGGIVETFVSQQLLEGIISPLDENTALTPVPLDYRAAVFQSLSDVAAESVALINNTLGNPAFVSWRNEFNIGISPTDRRNRSHLRQLLDANYISERDLILFADGIVTPNIMEFTGLSIASTSTYTRIHRRTSSSPQLEKLVKDNDLVRSLACLSNSVVLRMDYPDGADYHIVHLSGAMDLFGLIVKHTDYFESAKKIPNTLYADRGHYKPKELVFMRNILSAIKEGFAEIVIIEIKAISSGKNEESMNESLKRNHRYDPLHYTLTLLHSFKKLFPNEFTDRNLMEQLMSSIRYYLLKLQVHPMQVFIDFKDKETPSVPIPEIIPIDSLTKEAMIQYLINRLMSNRKRKK